MTDDSPVRVVVIGAAGRIGVRHVDHILEEPSTILTAIVDASQSPTGSELARKHNIPIFTTSEELIEARKNRSVTINAAIVATPNHTHVPIGILLIDHNITTMVEKPIAVESSSVRGLLKPVERAKKRGSTVVVLVGHHRRFNTYIRATKKVISSGILGKVAFQGTWSLLRDLGYFKVEWRTKAGSRGPILVNLVHGIDNLRYLFGDIE